MKATAAKKPARAKAAGKARSRAAKKPAADETLLVAEGVASVVEEITDERYVEQLLAATEALPQFEPAVSAATQVEPAPVAMEPDAESTALPMEANTTVDGTPSDDDSATATAVIVTLPSQCVLRDAAHLKDTLLPRLDDVAVVSIDAHQVERVDTATLQVLLVFVRDRHARERGVEWLGLNAAFVDAVRLLGIDGMLGLPAEEAAA